MTRQPYPCPQCAKPTSLAETNPWRPFCSERCRLIDLGEWLGENRWIPGEQVPPQASPDPE